MSLQTEQTKAVQSIKDITDSIDLPTPELYDNLIRIKIAGKMNDFDHAKDLFNMLGTNEKITMEINKFLEGSNQAYELSCLPLQTRFVFRDGKFTLVLSEKFNPQEEHKEEFTFSISSEDESIPSRPCPELHTLVHQFDYLKIIKGISEDVNFDTETYEILLSVGINKKVENFHQAQTIFEKFGKNINPTLRLNRMLDGNKQRFESSRDAIRSRFEFRQDNYTVILLEKPASRKMSRMDQRLMELYTIRRREESESSSDDSDTTLSQPDLFPLPFPGNYTKLHSDLKLYTDLKEITIVGAGHHYFSGRATEEALWWRTKPSDHRLTPYIISFGNDIWDEQIRHITGDLTILHTVLTLQERWMTYQH